MNDKQFKELITSIKVGFGLLIGIILFIVDNPSNPMIMLLYPLGGIAAVYVNVALFTFDFKGVD